MALASVDLSAQPGDEIAVLDDRIAVALIDQPAG